MIFKNFLFLPFLLVLLFVFGESFRSEGDVNIAVIFSKCIDSPENEYRQNQIDSALWIVDRLNFMGIFGTLKIGLQTYSACKDEDYFEILLNISRWKNEKYILGVISDIPVSTDVVKFSDILHLSIKNIIPDSRNLIESAVQLLDALDWDNVTVLSTQEKLVDELFEYSRLMKICIKKRLSYQANFTYDFGPDEGPFVLFGKKHQIMDFLSNNEPLQDFHLVIVPMDGLAINDIGENSYIILPSHIPLNGSNLIPSPLLFEIAAPILSYTEFLRTFLRFHCNETQYKLNCIKYKKIEFSNTSTNYTKEMILNILKIEPYRNNFVYDINKAGNDSDFFKMGYDFKQHLTKIFTFNIFEGNLENLENISGVNSTKNNCLDDRKCLYCENYGEALQISEDDIYFMEFRTEPWIIVFLAISAIGVLFSLLILAFIFVCICRKDILEGNPITTIFLLFSVLLMYCSVLSFSIQVNSSNKNFLCLLRPLWTTLSINGAFSLILSRCILLSTVSKEIAYMSHIPGSVQSFLTLFIFGVQAALSLQIIGNCETAFTTNSFLYIMSYNIMLLLLILCMCPVIYKSQRNYKEGKYFTISAVLITLCWCFWISCYRVLNDSWKHPLICFAMVSTASILQGVIFVSRTYLMTVFSARNKLRNNLPCLNERNGVLDVYRADARQVYDCVNVAAINAISVARAGLATTDFDEDIYNYPTLPRDEELNFDIQTNSSIQTDKVTRF